MYWVTSMAELMNKELKNKKLCIIVKVASCPYMTAAFFTNQSLCHFPYCPIRRRAKNFAYLHICPICSDAIRTVIKETCIQKPDESLILNESKIRVTRSWTNESSRNQDILLKFYGSRHITDIFAFLETGNCDFVGIITVSVKAGLADYVNCYCCQCWSKVPPDYICSRCRSCSGRIGSMGIQVVFDPVEFGTKLVLDRLSEAIVI